MLDLVRAEEKVVSAALGPNQSKVFLDRVAPAPQPLRPRPGPALLLARHAGLPFIASIRCAALLAPCRVGAAGHRGRRLPRRRALAPGHARPGRAAPQRTGPPLRRPGGDDVRGASCRPSPARPFLPRLDIYFPEGDLDLRVNRLINKVFFEGQVKYNFINGDITAFLRYRYYGYKRTTQFTVFDSIEFDGIDQNVVGATSTACGEPCS